ncbi:unnamed protein product [Amoebophrya sp. A25]|nr:unnamed protein product [Amoebophrya sp. A25]|eukprot:GSA25T00011155001.1
MTSTSFAVGVACALVAPLMITGGLVVWDARWTGHAIALNLYKCAAASVLFAITATCIGIWRTVNINDSAEGASSTFFGEDSYTVLQFWVLIVSGLIGITIGDNFWLTAVQLFGAQRVVLVDSLKPFLAVFLGWLFLDEGEFLESWAFVGGLTITSVGVVLTAREDKGVAEDGNISGREPEVVDERKQDHEIFADIKTGEQAHAAKSEQQVAVCQERSVEDEQNGVEEPSTGSSAGGTSSTDTGPSAPVTTGAGPADAAIIRDGAASNENDNLVRAEPGAAVDVELTSVNIEIEVSQNVAEVVGGSNGEVHKSKPSKDASAAPENTPAAAAPMMLSPFSGPGSLSPAARSVFSNAESRFSDIREHVKKRTGTDSFAGYSAAAFNVILDVAAAVMTKKWCKNWSPLDVNCVRFGSTAVIIGFLTVLARRWMYIHVHRQNERACCNHEPSKVGGDVIIRDEKGHGEEELQHNEVVAAEDLRKTARWYEMPTLCRKDWLFVSGAVFFVTFLGPTLATVALFRLPVALVIALTSVGPLYALPAVYIGKNESPTLAGIAGAALTVGGVALLCSASP